MRATLKAFIKPFGAPKKANQLTGFYMRATLALNGLNSLHHFAHKPFAFYDDHWL